MLKPTGETLVCKESATADDLFESDWQNSVRRPAPVFPVAPAPDVGRGKAAVVERYSRHGAPSLFEANDRFVRARLQQVYGSDQVIAMTDPGFAGAETDGLLQERDHLLYRPRVELHQARPTNANIKLRSSASAVSYSGSASSNRPWALSTSPLTKWADA